MYVIYIYMYNIFIYIYLLKYLLTLIDTFRLLHASAHKHTRTHTHKHLKSTIVHTAKKNFEFVLSDSQAIFGIKICHQLNLM